jgi:hypothetical protein
MEESCQTRRMFGHDYAIPGTYEVTMAVAGRRSVFGEIVGTTKAGGEAPHIKLSPLGQAVMKDEIPKIHHYYPMVDIWQVCLMPDHIHLIVRINAPLPPGKHLALSTALREATMKMCFVDGFMHADMHPGNMVRRDDGVLVLFDVGLATKLSPQVLETFVDMVKCIAMSSSNALLGGSSGWWPCFSARNGGIIIGPIFRLPGQCAAMSSALRITAFTTAMSCGSSK